MPGEEERGIEDFPVIRSAATRWSDNDMFGHLNNAAYYALFDSAINGWLTEATGIAPLDQPARGVVAQSSCRFLYEAGFPDDLLIGIGIERLGAKSVTYRLGLFRDGQPPTLAALGQWVHVYVDPTSRATVPIPAAIRAVLTAADPSAPQGPAVARETAAEAAYLRRPRRRFVSGTVPVMVSSSWELPGGHSASR